MLFRSFKKKTLPEDGQKKSFPLIKSALFFIAFILLYVLVFGREINGTKRWFSMSGMSFQPSEIARFILLVYLSWSLSKKSEYSLHNFVWGFLPKLFPVLAIVGLVILEPHFSVSTIMLGMSFGIFYIARARLSHLLSVFLVFVLLAGMWLWVNPYARSRIENKWKGAENEKTDRAGQIVPAQSGERTPQADQ